MRYASEQTNFVECVWDSLSNEAQNTFLFVKKRERECFNAKEKENGLEIKKRKGRTAETLYVKDVYNTVKRRE
jgi:hypothetical protein